MKLNSDELAMLQGRDGPAIAKAMDLLCRYGEALDAERLIDTRNVAGTAAATTPFMRDFAQRKGGMDAIFSEFNLDSDETVAIPPARVFSTHLQLGFDPMQGARMGISEEAINFYRKGEKFSADLGVNMTTPARRTRSATCPPAASTAPGWSRLQ